MNQKTIERIAGWRWVQAIAEHQWRVLAGLFAAAVALTLVFSLAGCAKGGSSHTVPPQAKASARATASQIAQGIKHGQAAQQAEGIVQHCFRTYSGQGLIRCVLPSAHHKALFSRCAARAFGSDIPGQEVKFVQADLPECLVKAR